MNIKTLHQNDKEVSAIGLFKGEIGSATAMQLQANGHLKEHLTKTPALLLCISGRVTYNDENERTVTMESGDYVQIIPFVKHWLHADVISQLVLLK